MTKATQRTHNRNFSNICLDLGGRSDSDLTGSPTGCPAESPAPVTVDHTATYRSHLYWGSLNFRNNVETCVFSKPIVAHPKANLKMTQTFTAACRLVSYAPMQRCQATAGPHWPVGQIKIKVNNHIFSSFTPSILDGLSGSRGGGGGAYRFHSVASCKARGEVFLCTMLLNNSVT